MLNLILESRSPNLVAKLACDSADDCSHGSQSSNGSWIESIRVTPHQNTVSLILRLLKQRSCNGTLNQKFLHHGGCVRDDLFDCQFQSVADWQY